MTFIRWDPVVHSCITLLTQDVEQIVKAFLSLDFAKPEPSLKLALEQVILLHLVSHIPVVCGEWHIDRGLTEDGCGRCRSSPMKSVLRPCFSPRWSDQEKQGGGYKNAYISGTVSQIDFKLGQNVDEGVPYH